MAGYIGIYRTLKRYRKVLSVAQYQTLACSFTVQTFSVLYDLTGNELYDTVFTNDARMLLLAQGMAGEMAIVSMRTVLLPDCKLNPLDKIAFLRRFLHSEYRRYILQYGKLAGRLPSGIRVQIFCAHLRTPLLLWAFYALTA